MDEVPEKSPARTKMLGLAPDAGNSKTDAATMHHGGSFHTYMALKNTKLREQFEANSLQVQKSDIFKGVSIFVNGITQPSALELKQIMMLHGGKFENYCYRGHVTHIICTNLPDTKLKQMAHERDPIPIVRPEWVVESLRGGKLLPTKDFQLSIVRDDDPKQLKLRPFRRVEPVQSGDLAAELYPQAAPGVTPETSVPPRSPLRDDLGGCATAGPGVWLAGGGLEQAVQRGQTGLSDEQRWSEAGASWHPALGQQQSCEPQSEGQGQHAQAPHQDPPQAESFTGWEEQQQQQQQQGPSAPPRHAAGQEPGTSPQQQQARAAALRRAQELAARLRSECDVLRGAPRTSKEDPNFVETFYRSSRLHFIGTWKARIEALLGGEIQEVGPVPHPPAGQFGKQSVVRSILHLDMDCFFASAAVAVHPEFRGLPLVISHSSSAKGSGEVSCANYEARPFGVHAGMFIAEARRLCPDLVVVPYLFDRYQEISEQVYRILVRYSSHVQPLSCDEALLDVTGLGDAEAIARQLREEIHQTTGCTASAGIGPSILVARLATQKGKPNGQYYVPKAAVMDFLADLKVDQLPGVGWSTCRKLSDLGISTVRQLRSQSKEMLQRQLGAKTGQTLWQYAHGIDQRVVEPCTVRRSVGAECNYGVRCEDLQDVERLLRDLAAQVSSRMKAAGVRGRGVTLKVKRRQAGAPEPIKFLGHGPCDNISRTITAAAFTDAADTIHELAHTMLLALGVPPEELRGIGIAVSMRVSKLDTEQASKAARPSAASAAKLAAPPRSSFDPKEYRYYFEAPHPPGAHPEEGQHAQAIGQRQHEGQQQVQPSHHQQPVGTWQQPGPTVQPDALAPADADWRAQGAAGSVADAVVMEPLEAPVDVAAARTAAQGPALADMADHSGHALPSGAQGSLAQRTAAQATAAAEAAEAAEGQVQVHGVVHAAGGALGATAVAAPKPTQARPAVATGSGAPAQQQRGRPEPYLDNTAGAFAGPSGPRAGPAKPRPGFVAPTLTLSQLDPEVMAGLPPDVRREVEAACGVAPRPHTLPSKPAVAGKGIKRKAAGAGSTAPKRQMRLTLSSKRPETAKPPLRSLVAPAEPLDHQPQRCEQGPNLELEGLGMGDVDPEVLAELPEDVRREVLQQLRGQVHRQGVHASHWQQQQQQQQQQQPWQQQQLQQRAGLGSAAAQAAHPVPRPMLGSKEDEDAARRQLFEAADPQEVRRAFEQRLLDIATAAAGAQSSAKAVEGPLLTPSKPASGLAQAHLSVSSPTSSAVAGPDSAIDPELLPGQKHPRQPLPEPCGERSPCAAAGEASPGWLNEQLHLLCELVVQWLVSLDDHLEEVARGVRMLQRMCRDQPALREMCSRAVHAVQQHLQDKFGFYLDSKGALS